MDFIKKNIFFKKNVDFLKSNCTFVKPKSENLVLYCGFNKSGSYQNIVL